MIGAVTRGHVAIAAVRDSLNKEWTYKYDLLGRKIEAVDPDAGTSTYTYDNLGRMLTFKDGRNVVLAYAYDNLGRKTAVHETSLTGFKRAEWVYDTVDKGYPTSMSRFEGGQTYTTSISSYDDGYRPESVTQTVPGFGAAGGVLTYTVTNTYKVNGALASQAVPAVGGLPAETLTHGYADTGVPTTLSSGQGTYIFNTNYSYEGQVSQYIYGAAGKQVKVTNTLDAATRRLKVIKTETETATAGTFTERHVNDYGYDAAGNVTAAGSIVDGVRDQFECFRYDYLRRLTEAWSQPSGGIGCGTPQRTGADPYWRQWTFDKIGNRLTQKDVDSSCGNTDWAYEVGEAFGVKPHQVKNVKATGPRAGTATRTFTYDGAGNTLTATTATGVGQTYDWDKEGHLASVTEGTNTTTYVYDAEGKRLIARTPTRSVLYLADGTELETPSGGGSALATRYYGPHARRDAAGLRFIVSDQHGTSVVQIDSVTLAVDRRRNLPYGEPRGTQPAGWKGDKGFVGGTIDNTGLTHLGAREYDPTLGRFVSADPAIDMTDPQQWHAYTYANGNPLTWSDPTGEIICGDDGCNQTAVPNPSGGYYISGTPQSSVASCAPNCPKRKKKEEQWVEAYNKAVDEALTTHGDLIKSTGLDKYWDDPLSMPDDVYYQYQGIVDAVFCQMTQTVSRRSSTSTPLRR